MKKFIQIIIPALLLLSTISCKKDEPVGRSKNKSTLSFNYNGKPYNLIYTDNGEQEWGAFNDYLIINRPDIFGGVVRIIGPQCGYMEPYVGAISVSNCNLTTSSGMPIDSTIVYTYQSGSVRLTFSNCETKEGIDFTTGERNTYQICDGDGTFSLLLKNKEGKQINITNGVIKLYNIIR